MKNLPRLVLTATLAFATHQAALATELTPLTKVKHSASIPQMPAHYKQGTLEMASAAASVQMSYEFVNAMVDGHGLLTLKIARVGGGEPALLELRPDAAISLPTGLPTPQARFNEGDSYVVKVKPAPQGLHYINVFLHVGHVTQARAIAVQVGNLVHAQKTSQVRVMSDGRQVISVPAPLGSGEK
jgi:hypothetical protein